MESISVEVEQESKQAIRPATRALDVVFALAKRLVLLIFFGPGVLGTLWLVGKIFRRR